MDREKVVTAVKKILSVECGFEYGFYTLDTKLVEIGFDSLDIVRMGLAVEEELGIELPDPDLTKIITVGDFVTYVETHV